MKTWIVPTKVIYKGSHEFYTYEQPANDAKQAAEIIEKQLMGMQSREHWMIGYDIYPSEVREKTSGND